MKFETVESYPNFEEAVKYGFIDWPQVNATMAKTSIALLLYAIFGMFFLCFSFTPHTVCAYMIGYLMVCVFPLFASHEFSYAFMCDIQTKGD